MFLGSRKEKLKLYKTKKGWVLAKKTAIVLGTTTVIGLSLTVNASANNVDTPTSDSTVVATANTDDKKEVANKDEVPTPTTATSELNNTNEGTSDSTSDTADKTSNEVKDSTSETNSVSSSSVDTSNQPVTNIESTEAKSATTSLMATAEPTVTPSPVSTEPTETQPTLTTAQTDNTQVKPVTSWTSANGDYHVELNKNQISAEDNELEIKISGTSKAGDKLYIAPQRLDNNYKDIYTKVGIDANQSRSAYSDSVRASVSTTALSGNGTTSLVADTYKDDFSGSATFEQNWILTGKGLDNYAPNNQHGYLLRQDLMEATGTKTVLTPIFLQYYDSATEHWEWTVLTYNSLVKNVQPTATLAPVAKDNRYGLVTDPNQIESRLSAFSGEPFVINIESNAKLISNINGKQLVSNAFVDNNYIKEATYTIPVPDDFKLDIDASFKTSKNDNLSFSQADNVITVKYKAKADGTLYDMIPNIALVGHIADDKYKGIKQAQAPISISETLINNEVITKEAGTIVYQKNNGKSLANLPIYWSYDNDNAPGQAGNIMLDNLATQPATQVGSCGFANTSGITLNKVGFTSVVADGFNVNNIRAFLYSDKNLKGTATGNYTIHYVDGTTKTGSVQLSTEEKALVDDGTKQIASIEWSIDGLGNLISFSNDLMGNLAHTYRDGSLVKVGDTLKNHYKLYGQYSNNANGVTNTTFYGGEGDQIEHVVDSALHVRSGLWTFQTLQGAGNKKMGDISICPGYDDSDSDVKRVFEPIIYYVLDEGINVNEDVFKSFPRHAIKPKVSKFRLNNGQLVLKLDFTGTGNSFGVMDGVDYEYRVSLDIDSDAVNGNYYGYGYIDLTNDIKKNPRHKGDSLIDPALAKRLGANALTTINSGKGMYTVNSAQSAYQSNYVKANADNDLTNAGLAYTNQDKSMTYYVNGVNNTNNPMPLTMVVNFPQASADSFKFSLTGPIELDGYTVKYATALSDLNATTPQVHFVDASGISDWSQVKSIELIKNEVLDAHQSTGRLAIHGLDSTLKDDAGKTGTFSTVSYFGSLKPFKPERVSVAVKYDPEYVKTLVNNDRKETPYKNIYQADDSLEAGQKVTKQTGIVDVVTSQTTYTISEDGRSLVPNTTTNHEVVGQDEIILVGVKPVVEKTTEPYKTVYQADDNLEAGQKVTKQEGKVTTTTKTTTYVLNVETGEVTPKTNTQVDKGQDEIILIGIKPKVEKETTPFKTIYRENNNLDHGQQQEVQSGKDTVKTTTTTYELNVETGEVTPHVDSQTDNGQDRIVEVGIKSVVEKGATPFKTIYQADDNLEAGQKVTKQEGKVTTTTKTTTYTLNVETGEVTPKTDTQVDKGQDEIILVGIKPKVETETTPFKTVYRENDNLDHGQTHQVQSGKDTTKTTTTTYELNLVDGSVNSKTSIVVDTGRDQIIEVGIKPVTTTEVTPFKIVYRTNDQLTPGQVRVIQVGKDTTVVTTTSYKLNLTDGTVTSKTAKTTDQGQDQIVEIGIAPKSDKDVKPFETVYVPDETLEAGKQVIDQVGKNTTTITTTTYTLDENYQLVPHTQTSTVEGQNQIVRVGIKPVTKVDTKGYQTTYVENKDLPAGKQVTKQDGKTTITTSVTTYTLDTKTGEVTPSSKNNTSLGQDKVVEVGTKPVVVVTKTPSETKYQPNYDLDYGKRNQIQVGKDTVTTTTTNYRLDKQTGKVTSTTDTKVTNGQDEIIEVGLKPVTVVETTGFKVIYVADESLEAGKQVIDQEGKVTTKTTTTTYALNTKSGEVTSHTNSKLDKGQDKIVRVGIKPVVETTTEPYKTIYQADDNLEAGKKVVVQVGKDTTTTTTTTNKLNKSTGEVTSTTNTQVDKGQDEVVKVGIKPVVVQTETPYQTEYVEDKNLDEGQTKLIQPGKNTLVVTTTTYTLLADGSVQANEPAENKTTGQNEIIAVGVKKATGQKDNQTQTKVQNSTKEQLKVTNVTPKAPFEQPKDLKVAQKAKTLPQTGIDETNLGILSLMFMSLVGFVSTLFKKKNH